MMSALLLALILNITLIIVQSQCPFDLISVNSMVCWIMQFMIEWMNDTGRNATTVNNGR